MRVSLFKGSLPSWFPFLDLALAVTGGAMWYLQPSLGPWPLVLVATPWLIRLLWLGRPGWRSPFDGPLLFFVGTAGLSVWSAFDRTAAWSKFWLIVGGVFLFYALANGLAQAASGSLADLAGADGRREREEKRLADKLHRHLAERYVWLLAIFGAGVAVYFLASHDWDVYPGKVEFLERLGRALQSPLPVLPGHRLHPNVAGGLMAMMVPFSALTAILSGQRLAGDGHDRRPLLLFLSSLGLLLLTLLGLLLSSSRGAWLALVAAGVLAVWELVSRHLSGRQRNRRVWIFFGGLTAAAAAVWLLFLIWPQSLSSLLNGLPELSSGLGRLDLYQNSLILAMDYPLIGAGLNSFMMLYSTYALLIHVGFSVHSHNLFLNVAIEQGLLALLALAWMWLLMGEAVWRKMASKVQRKRRRSRSNPAGLGWAEVGMSEKTQLSAQDEAKQERHHRSRGPSALNAAALSLVIMLVHGLVDDPVYGSRAVLMIFIPLAFAAPELTEGLSRSAGGKWQVWAIGLGLLLVLSAFWWGRSVYSMAEANLAAVNQSRAELSVYSWPEWPIQDAVRRDLDMEPVIAGYERALTLNPENGPANRRLGQIELSLGEYERALDHLEAAYRAAPWDNATRQLLGEAYIVNGKTAEGELLWAGVNDAQGQLDIRAFWYEYVGDEERLAAVKGIVKR